MTAIEFNSHLIKYQPQMRSFALSLTMNREEAYDLVQETNIKALINRSSFSQPNNLKAWLFTIMRNIFINTRKRGNKLNNILTEAKDNSFGWIYKRSEGRNTTESRHDTNHLRKIIDGLEEEYKTPFKMHVDGYKYHEISEAMSLNIGTVKSRIFHARKKLMEQTRDYVI